LVELIGHEGSGEAVVARSLAVLTVVLGMLLTAAPALLAQEVSASVGSEVEATGYLSPVYPRDAYAHLLNDETKGITYFARSENVDLDSYDDDQMVEVTGTLVVEKGCAPGSDYDTSDEGDSDDGLLGGAASCIRGLLPGTGGTVILALIGACILLAGGLLLRRLFR